MLEAEELVDRREKRIWAKVTSSKGLGNPMAERTKGNVYEQAISYYL
jgi:hypothetical protein